LVVASVDPAGAAAQAGIQRGDVILEVNHQRVRNGGDISSALAKSGNRPALLQVMRGGQTLFVAVPQG
jgi:S1-C subfamily serine protease